MMYKTYNDFIQLIDASEYNDYQVCLMSSSLKKEIWTASDYLNYLDNLERHKLETGISIQYDFFYEDNKVLSVDTTIHYLEEKDAQGRDHLIHWIVKYNSNK